MKLCECGCGNAAPIAKANNRRKGHVKGEPVRFISGHNCRGVPKSDQMRARLSAAKTGVSQPRNTGPRPGAWKSDSYEAAHHFLRLHFPKTGFCDECGQEGLTDFSFLHHPEPPTRIRSDYRELCRSCHVQFDYDIGARPRAEKFHGVPA